MITILFNAINKPNYFLLPTYNLKSINEIQSKHLEGVKYIIFDKDDTLTLLGSDVVIPTLRNKFFNLADKYKCMIVSNGKKNPKHLEGVKIL